MKMFTLSSTGIPAFGERKEEAVVLNAFSFTAAWQQDWGSIVIFQYATSSVMQYKKTFYFLFLHNTPEIRMRF